MHRASTCCLECPRTVQTSLGADPAQSAERDAAVSCHHLPKAPPSLGASAQRAKPHPSLSTVPSATPQSPAPAGVSTPLLSPASPFSLSWQCASTLIPSTACSWYGKEDRISQKYWPLPSAEPRPQAQISFCILSEMKMPKPRI